MKRISNKNEEKVRTGFLTFLRTCSFLIMLCVFLLSALLFVPRLFRIQYYHILSPSMEPEIMTDSLVVCVPCEAQELAKGDIIVFLHENIVICHRVEENDKENRQLETKGDNNPIKDLWNTDYSDVCGKVVWHKEKLGLLLDKLMSLPGKLLLFGVLGVSLSVHLYTQRQN